MIFREKGRHMTPTRDGPARLVLDAINDNADTLATELARSGDVAMLRQRLTVALQAGRLLARSVGDADTAAWLLERLAPEKPDNADDPSEAIRSALTTQPYSSRRRSA